MATFDVSNPLDGRLYTFEIDGDTPTEQESLEIQQFLALRGQEKVTEQVPDDGNLFTKGVSRGIDQLQRAYGDALVGVGKGFGIEGLVNYGQEVSEENTRQLEEQAKDARRLDSINNLSTFGDYAASVFGEQLPNLAPSVIGGAVGSFLGPAGTIGGIKIGTLIGAGLANLPYFYGDSVPASTDPVTGEVNQLKALTYAAPMAALDTLGDLLVTAGFAGKLLSGGGLFTRSVKGAGKGVAAEVPTEIGQEILARHRDGKPLWDQEALDTYIEVAAAAGLVGGTVSSVGNIVGGDKDKQPDKISQLDSDDRIMAQQVQTMNTNAVNFINQQKDIESFKSTDGKFVTLSQLPNHIQDEIKDKRIQEITYADVVSGTTDFDLEINKETLTQEELDVAIDRTNDLEADTKDLDYNKVKDAVKKEGQFTQAIAKKALKTKSKKPIPQSKINGIRDKLLQNNVIKKDKAKLVATLSEEQDIRIKSEQLKARVKSIMKDMDKLQKEKKKLGAIGDLSIDQVNRLDEINGEIDDLSKKYSDTSKAATNLASRSDRKLGKNVIRLGQIIPPLEAKSAFDNANFKTDEYKAKQSAVQKSLKASLAAIGLGNIKLDFKPILTPRGQRPEEAIAEGTVTEGVYSNKTIALAMEIYDPSLTETELQQRLGSVMNHEIIHALFELGVFTQQEQNILVNAAKNRKYVQIINGEKVERKYTYLDRANRMYQTKSDGSKYTAEEQAEEAIAELYRDFADGKIVLGGKPKTLLSRIINFFKTLFQSHKEAGFNKAGDLFRDIGSTNFQRRVSEAEKKSASPDALQDSIERESRLVGPSIIPDNVLETAQFIRANKQNSTDQTKIMNKLFKNRQLEEGQMVTVRPNLNGFVQLDDGSIGMTQTVHPAKSYGTALGYDSVVAIKDSELMVSPQKRADIYKGVTRTGVKQDKVPMAGGYGGITNISRQEIEDIVSNPDNILSFNPGSEARGINGTHLFTDKNGYAVKSIKGTAVHLGSKVFVKGNVNFYTEDNAPKPVDNLPSDVKYVPFETEVSLIDRKNQEKFSQLRGEIRANISAATDSITGLSELQKAANKGDEDAMVALQEVAINSVDYLTQAIPNVEVESTPAYGLYGSDLEPAVGLKITFDEGRKDLALSALEKFAQNFNQEQIHVRQRVADRFGRFNNLVGYQFGDGSYNTPVVSFRLTESIPTKELSSIIDKTGLAGFTVTDKSLQAYYLGDPNDRTAIRDFRKSVRGARKLLGPRISSLDTRVERLWAYGSGYGATNSYEQIRGDFPLPETDQADKTANRIANRLAQRLVDPTVQAKTLTDKQKNLQMEIAKDYDAMGINNLDNPTVRRAYTELAQEVTEQYNAMPIKVEIYQDEGEPYTGARMSEAMRKDILANNHLYIFGTEADTFGPEGVVYDNHPLLEPTNIVDINGRPMLVNDLLRAVHDYYAHTMSTVGFGPLGEEAAWRNHMIMTKSPYARWALTSETRGQNSWVNFNESALGVEKLSDRPFAEQKVDLLPVKYLITNDPEVDASLGELTDSNFDADPEKYSIKGIKPRDLTILDRMDENGQFEQRAKVGSVKMTEAVKQLHAERGNITLDINNAEDRELAELAMFEELKAQVEADESAIGWYDDKIKLAKELYAISIPIIKTDKNAEAAFEFVLAISSNGEAVVAQSNALKTQMENWERTGELLLQNQGSQASAMEKSFLTYNILKKEKGMTDLEIKKFLQVVRSKKEIENDPLIQSLTSLTGGKVTFKQETADEMVPMSFIFGSKIGAFYQNIIGNYEYLTMDRWFMRFVNRIFGVPFRTIGETTLVKNKQDALREFQKALESGTEDEISRIKVATDELGTDIINISNVGELSTLINGRFNKDIERIRRKKLGTKEFIDTYKTEFLSRAQRLAENLETRLQETPKTPTNRKQFRVLYNRVIDRYNRQTNRQITVADSQAVYWYGEKRLFKSIGVAPGQGSDNDYVDAAIAFLRKEGIDDQTIGEALPPTERERLADKRGAGQGSIDSTGQVDTNIGHEKREYTEEELVDYDPAKDVDPKDLELIKETINDQKFAMISTGKQNSAYGATGELGKYLYGVINLDNRSLPVFFVDGKHEEIPRGNTFLYSGFGNDHITAVRPTTGKSHEQELLETFKYKNIKDLFYDNLAKLYYQQNRDDVNNGVEIVNTTATGVRLEFNRTPQRGAKQNKFVMPLKFVKRGEKLDETSPSFKFDSFVIRTGYPEEKLFKQSMLSTASMNQQETPMSAEIDQGISNTRIKIQYDNLSRVLAKVGHKFTLGRVEEDDLRKAAQNLLIQIQDRFLPIGALMDKLRENGAKITDAMDTYMQEELFHGIAGAKVEKAQKEFFDPMIKTINTLDVNQDSLNTLSRISNFYKTAIDGRYPSRKMALADAILYAAHAKERNDYLKNPIASGMHTNEADRINNWILTLPDSEKTKIKNIKNFAKSIVKNTNEERKQGGLIPEVFTDKEGNQYERIYENYVPLRGDLNFEDEADSDSKREERAENFVIQNLFGATKRPDRKARGRVRSKEGEVEDFYAENIVATLFAQNNKSIADAERNKVGLSYLNLVRGIEDGTTEVNDNLKKEMQHISAVYFNKDDIPKDLGEKEQYLTVRENGRNVYITLNDARIARAMKGFMTPDSVGSFTRALGKLNRYLSNINTTYNPSFVIPNFARDLGTAGVNVQQYDEKGLMSEVLKSALPAVKGISKNLRDGDVDSFWAKEYTKFVESGGKNATNQMNDLQDQMNSINSILSDVSDNSKKGKLGLVKKGFGKLGKFLDDYNTAVENGVRVSLYTALVKRGVSTARAAQAARNLTVNFAKGGEQKQFLNSWYLFYNASMQGSMALINAAVKSKRVRKVWAGLFVYGVMQDAFNSLLSGDEDEDGIKDYDELPRYILEHNFVLPTFGLAEDKFITIPLAYGMNLAVNAGRAVSRAARGEYTPGEASRTIFGTAFESLSPFGGFDNFYNLAAPTVLDPFVSVAINEDYKGDPIFKESPQFASRPTPNSQAYWSSTSGTAVTIANFLNSISGGDAVESGFVDLSPDVMEFWFDYTTGGVGRFVQRSLESPFRIYDAINEDLQAPLTSVIPFARKVIASPSEREDVSSYLENRKALFTILARYDLARRSGDVELTREIFRDNREQLSIVPRLKAIDNARNRLLRQIREIERNPRLDEKVIKNLIKIRRDRINDLMRRGLILMRSAGFREAS